MATPASVPFADPAALSPSRADRLSPSSIDGKGTDAGVALPCDTPAAGDFSPLDNYLRKLRPVDLAGAVNPRKDGRLADHRWREVISPSRRIAHCNRHPIAKMKGVSLLVRPNGEGGAVARFAGLQRCGSVWSCPECSRHIAAARVEIISQAMATAHGKGYGACWQTLTLPHKAPDKLADTLALVSEAWRDISASRGWKELRRELEIVGLFRKVEVTHGVNGWHPHAHVTFITRRPLTDAELDRLELFVFEAWSRVVVARGFAEPWPEFCPLEAINLETPGADWAEYIGKMVGLEFAGTGKRRKGTTGRTPFEILDGAVALAKEFGGNTRMIREAGDPRLGAYAVADARLWAEYQRGTKGRHQMHWSRGLKAALGVAGGDLEGEQLELADAMLAEQEEEVHQLTPYEWHQLQREPARLLALLAIAEAPAPLRDRRREIRLWLAHWTGIPADHFLSL